MELGTNNNNNNNTNIIRVQVPRKLYLPVNIANLKFAIDTFKDFSGLVLQCDKLLFFHHVRKTTNRPFEISEKYDLLEYLNKKIGEIITSSKSGKRDNQETNVEDRSYLPLDILAELQIDRSDADYENKILQLLHENFDKVYEHINILNYDDMDYTVRINFLHDFIMVYNDMLDVSPKDLCLKFILKNYYEYYVGCLILLFANEVINSMRVLKLYVNSWEDVTNHMENIPNTITLQGLIVCHQICFLLDNDTNITSSQPMPCIDHVFKCIEYVKNETLFNLVKK